MRSPGQQVKTEGPKLREGGRGMELEDLQGALRIMGWWGDDGIAITEVGGRGAMTDSVWKMQRV